jgi:malonyl-CoA/methylmalonyl-CoA synthetase
MYHRIAEMARAERSVAQAFGRARLLVSGSAALPGPDHERIRELTGQVVHERYGMTETLITAGARVGEPVRAGRVGPPLPGVEIRLLDDDGVVLEAHDDETIGEISVRGPNLFEGYLNQPAATDDGWFRTGDLATRDESASLRIVGRRATDLIKSGGYRIGAGEIEGALLEHPAVAEAAVKGLPDEDLGERVVAWVVLEPDQRVSEAALSAHVEELLSGHKRPREVRFVSDLPRNELGKVIKAALNG